MEIMDEWAIYTMAMLNNQRVGTMLQEISQPYLIPGLSGPRKIATSN